MDFLLSFSFLDFSIADAIDIVVVGLLIFFLLNGLKSSSATAIVVTIVAIYIVRAVCSIFQMRLITSLMTSLLDTGVIALIIIFQPEIRQFIRKLGVRYRTVIKKNYLLSKVFLSDSGVMENESVLELLDACSIMSQDKTGALIVLKGEDSLDDILATGDEIDAKVSSPLIRNIFFKNSPLHDGAMIIRDDIITAARCTLPLTERNDLPKSYGMRHKAAIGITEKTDAKVILVSEETGHIAYCSAGKVTIVQNTVELNNLLGDIIRKSSKKSSK